jgi:hypothetical protein
MSSHNHIVCLAEMQQRTYTLVIDCSLFWKRIVPHAETMRALLGCTNVGKITPSSTKMLPFHPSAGLKFFFRVLCVVAIWHTSCVLLGKYFFVDFWDHTNGIGSSSHKRQSYIASSACTIEKTNALITSERTRTQTAGLVYQILFKSSLCHFLVPHLGRCKTFACTFFALVSCCSYLMFLSLQTSHVFFKRLCAAGVVVLVLVTRIQMHASLWTDGRGEPRSRMIETTIRCELKWIDETHDGGGRTELYIIAPNWSLLSSQRGKYDIHNNSSRLHSLMTNVCSHSSFHP